MRRRRQAGEEQEGKGMSEELMMLIGMKEWRQQHPQASLREIEEAMDARLNLLRARMLEEVIKMSPQSDWSQTPREQRPKCQHCGTPLRARGKQERRLQTSGGQEIKMERTYGTCPECGEGFFPLG